MKRLFLFLAAVVMLAGFSACGDKKAPVNKKPRKVYTFTKQDSTEVLSLVSQFTARLQNNDLRGAVEMLNILKGDSVFPMEPVQQRRQAMALGMVRGIRYDLNYVRFNSDRNNEIKLDITLFEKQSGDPRPNMTGFYLRPVRFEGKWYLTVKDNITDRENSNYFEKEGTDAELSETEEE